MRDFEQYSPEDVIYSNLNEISNRADMLGEQELAHLKELAAEIMSEGDLQEILAALHDRRPPSAKCYDGVLEENRRTLSDVQRLSDGRRSMLLCTMLAPLLEFEKGLTLDAFFSDTPHPDITSAEHISYPKSSYTDAAYLSLTSTMREPHVSYAHSFVSACEEVYNGLCDYCILPLESSAEGILVGFLRQIIRYDLKIAATCEIASHSEGKITRFALLSREISMLNSNALDEAFFTLLLPSEISDELSKMLSAASFFGHMLVNVGFLTDEENAAEKSAYATFSIRKDRLHAFLLYLAMELPSYMPLGIYQNTKKKGKS